MALSQEQQNILQAFQGIAADIKSITVTLGNKADLNAGKLNPTQVPDIAVVDYCGTVANQATMLAVQTPGGTAPQKGDWCVRSDDGKVYIVTGSNPSQAASWTALSYPAPVAPDNYSYLNAYNTAKA